MALKLANNATSTLASSIDDSQTSVSVQTADAALFPALGAGDWFPVTAVDASGNIEVMKVTARSGATLTVERGQEGTAAQAFDAGSRVDLRMTAATLEAFQLPAQIAGAADEALSDADAIVARKADGSLVRQAWGAIRDALEGYFETLFAAEDHTHEIQDTEGLEAALNARNLEPGTRRAFYRRTAPTGWLKANGAAVLVSSYTALNEAIYVGDTDNATADWGYHCTNPADPDGSRSTAGAYLVLPDARGEFERGFDDGRGVDAGRAWASAQGDQNKAHTHAASTGAAGGHSHSTSDPGHSHDLALSASGDNTNLWHRNGNNQRVASGDGNHAYWDYGGAHPKVTGIVINSAAAHTHSVTVTSDGGSEARPRNLAPLICIKY